jgi:hypothetical protein
MRATGRIKTFSKYFSPACPIHKLITDTKSFLHTHYANFSLTRNSGPLVGHNIVNYYLIVLIFNQIENIFGYVNVIQGLNGKLISA